MPSGTLAQELESIGVGVQSMIMACAPMLIGLGLGVMAAYVLDHYYSATSSLDAAAMLGFAGVGLAWNIRSWIKRSRAAPVLGDPGEEVLDAAVTDLKRAFRMVLGTPTLV